MICQAGNFFYEYECLTTALKRIEYLTDTVLISRLFWFLGVPDSRGEEAEDDFLVVGGPVDEFGFGRSQSFNSGLIYFLDIKIKQMLASMIINKDN